METIRGFEMTNRYKFDCGTCSSKNGFAQLDTKQDASYYGIWANPYKRIVFTYCEGDTTLITCSDNEEFITEINKIASWNIEQGWGFNIDAYGQEEKWIELGFARFLH